MLSRSGMRCITTPKTTDNKSAAGNSAQAKTQAVALGASEHSGKLFKSKVGANGFEPSTSCSQGRRANQAALRPAVRIKETVQPLYSWILLCQFSCQFGRHCAGFKQLWTVRFSEMRLMPVSPFYMVLALGVQKFGVLLGGQKG